MQEGNNLTGKKYQRPTIDATWQNLPQVKLTNSAVLE